MTTNAELQKLREAAVPRGVSSMLPVFTERASNAELWDVEGKRYVDFAAGIAVLNTGHVHPRIREAVERQLQLFTHTCFQVTQYEVYVRLAERINRLAPGATPKKTIFLSTGAEAVENAIKIARAHTRRSAVISFGGGFHGRTMLAMGLTGKVVPYKVGFGPFPAEIYHVPFPVAYHGISAAESLTALDELFHSDVEPSRVAAIIIEPVEFLRRLRAICDQHGIVFIADEIQTGFARTGRMFAIEHSGVEPDLMTLAKSIAGGFPLSAVCGKAAIMDAPAPGGLGGTYAGSPIACAAGLAAMDVIEEEKLCERAGRIGELMRARLAEMRERNSLRCIGEIRGLGAMVAIELVKDNDAEQPDPDLAKALVQAAARRGLIILSCGVRGNVIRFLAPLTAPEAIVNEGLGILEKALLEVAQR
jgi:4-aminobutyrate aminotransferase/(S)-3-amino-2-methylpropionate transaminase